MNNEIISNNAKLVLINICKAIQKGVEEDMRTYLDNNKNVVNNALHFLRGDFIITNIRNTVISDTVEMKLFKRGYWTGCIILNRIDKHSYSICSKNTLDSIPKKVRNNPHFLQTLLNIENKSEVAVMRQMTFSDYGISIGTIFTDDEYENDFYKIMEEALSLKDDYRHWVIVYEADHNNLIGLSAMLLDGDFGVVKEISLMEFIQPDFGKLTSKAESDELEKDAHSLVSIKPGLVGRKSSEKEKQTEIVLKSLKESKES